MFTLYIVGPAGSNHADCTCCGLRLPPQQAAGRRGESLSSVQLINKCPISTVLFLGFEQKRGFLQILKMNSSKLLSPVWRYFRRQKWGARVRAKCVFCSYSYSFSHRHHGYLRKHLISCHRGEEGVANATTHRVARTVTNKAKRLSWLEKSLEPQPKKTLELNGITTRAITRAQREKRGDFRPDLPTPAGVRLDGDRKHIISGNKRVKLAMSSPQVLPPCKPTVNLRTPLMDSPGAPARYLKSAPEVQLLADALGFHLDVYCVVPVIGSAKKEKTLVIHEDQLAVQLTENPIALIVQIFQSEVFVLAAVIKVDCNVDFFTYFSRMEQFLQPCERSSLKSGNIYRFGCSFQPACDGCAFLNSTNGRIQQLRFPFREKLPGNQEIVFKRTLAALSSAEAGIISQLFPEADSRNTAHQNCKIGNTFTGITLVSSAEHRAHLDPRNEGPTVVHNFTSPDSQAFLALHGLRLCSTEDSPVIIRQTNGTLVTFFSQKVRHSASQFGGVRYGVVNFRHQKLDRPNHGRIQKCIRDQKLHREENEMMEEYVLQKKKLLKAKNLNCISESYFKSKWHVLSRRENKVKETYRTLRGKCLSKRRIRAYVAVK